MSNNDWTNKLRDSLADYQEPVKADLWASIEQSLAQQGILPEGAEAAHEKKSGSEPKNAARLMAFKKWSAVAAAVALLGVGGSYVYLHQDGSAENRTYRPLAESKPQSLPAESKSQSPADLQSAASMSAPQQAQNPTAASKSASLLSASAAVKTAPLLAQNATHPSVYSRHFGAANDSYNLVSDSKNSDVNLLAAESESPSESPADLQSAANMEANSVKLQSAASKEANPVKVESQQQVARNNNLKQDDALFGVDFASDLKRHTDWNVQFYAENGLFTTSSVNQGSPMLSSGTYYDSAIPGSFVTNTSMTAPYASFLKSVNMKKPKHHAPLSVGVQVGIPLVSRLSLSTGLVYTRAASDFALYSNQDFDTHQVLHYVGVPVGVNYEVWGTRHFHTYVMAGGEVDFNVKNSTTRNDEPVDDVKRDRPQFSAKASVGAQLDVTPQIGVYVEPGAKYYFDNGSSIDNTFKDKKLNFNFQFGLRWNIGK